jgi:hypothetical protein
MSADPYLKDLSPDVPPHQYPNPLPYHIPTPTQMPTKSYHESDYH